MAPRPRGSSPARAARTTQALFDRYTVDASVFVNAFNRHERGHGASLALLTHIHETGAPVILPALALAEIASAVARAADQEEAALEYAAAVAALPEMTLVSLTVAAARDAAELAAVHRLRGADAVYAAVARRHATTLVTRDEQQRQRASVVVACMTPEEALAPVAR